MFQLYIFIVAVIVILVILFRRFLIFRNEKQQKFKKEVSHSVKENRKQEHIENKKRFKDELAKEQSDQKFDLNKYKENIRKADVAIAKKQWNNAKKFLIQAISLSKDNDVSALLRLSEVYLNSGDTRKAETMYRKLLEIDANNSVIHENLAKILTKRKRYKEAIQAYVRAVEIDDKDDKKFVALGRIYRLLMHYSVAAECFRRAAELKPRQVDYLFLLADTCEFDDDCDNALFTYEKILTMEPYNDEAKERVSDLRLKIKENEVFFV